MLGQFALQLVYAMGIVERHPQPLLPVARAISTVVPNSRTIVVLVYERTFNRQRMLIIDVCVDGQAGCRIAIAATKGVSYDWTNHPAAVKTCRIGGPGKTVFTSVDVA